MIWIYWKQSSVKITYCSSVLSTNRFSCPTTGKIWLYTAVSWYEHFTAFLSVIHGWVSICKSNAAKGSILSFG